MPLAVRSGQCEAAAPAVELIQGALLGRNLFGDLRALCDLPSELLFGPGNSDPCGGTDTGEQERAEEKRPAPRADQVLPARELLCEFQRMCFKDGLCLGLEV